jgi:hypothetical protein
VASSSSYLRIALCIIRGFLLGHGTTPGQWPSAFQKMFSIAQTLVFRAGTFRFVRTPLFVIDDVLDCCQSCRDLLSQNYRQQPSITSSLQCLRPKTI